jgi:peptidoglycan/xylan/chitin deacetylase (PgdA/CDA1 family)
MVAPARDTCVRLSSLLDSTFMPARHVSPPRSWALATLLLTLLVAACSDSPTEPEPDPDPEVTLQVEPLGSLDVEVGGELSVQVVVRSDGEPLAGAAVEWAVTEGEGTVEPGSSITDEEGRTEGTWAVGTLAGPGALRIRVQGAEEKRLDAMLHPGAPEALASIPDTLHLRARRAQGRAPVVFHDRYGNQTTSPSDLSWTVEDPAVASVAGDGLVSAGEEGVTALLLTSSAGEASIPLKVVHEGVITVTFDDGFRSVHERAFPILEGLGIKANVAVVTQAVDESWPDFLDLDQLTDLHDAGWAVASHSVSHARLDTISMAQVHRELSESRSWIEAQGFRGSGVFVVPYHEWNESVRDAVAEHYVLARGRGLWKGAVETEVEWIPEDRMDLSALDVDWYGLESEEELDWLRETLARAVEEGGYFELYFHRVEEGQVEAFTRVVEVVAEFSEHVRTFDQLLHQVEGTGLPAPSSNL